jgi:UDP-4-amino-4,6-dideoxy-N-acetyl-beta-L-altrosamine transaminase
MSRSPSPARKLTSLSSPGEEGQGEPAARPFLAYGRQVIEEDDIAAVANALRGDLLTTGPVVARFEEALAETVCAGNAVACANGTAALYMAARALDLGPGTTVIVPAISFAATASAPHLAGAEIVFCDVDPESGAMQSRDLEAALARCKGRAHAVFPVHYAGQACDMDSIAQIARMHDLFIVEDAAHALGTARADRSGALVPVGANARADCTIFSFHPVKTVAMGEGGAVTANDPELIRRLKRARNHGIARDAAEFANFGAAFDSAGRANPWYYEVQAPGFNFRVPDINCALGLSQLAKLARFVARRRALVAAYDGLLAPFAPLIRPLARDPRSLTAWHIYPVHIDFAALGIERGALMRALAADGIGTQVHYLPLHRHPYYAPRHGAQNLPGADAYYATTLSLPLHAGMDDSDPDRVVAALCRRLGI